MWLHFSVFLFISNKYMRCTTTHVLPTGKKMSALSPVYAYQILETASQFFTSMCFLHFTLLMEYYLQPCPSCFTSFHTNSQAKNSILSTNLDQMGNKASINIPSSIRQYLSSSTEKHIDLRNYTSEDNKKLRASRIMLGSGEDANEPTSTKRDVSPTY